MGLDYKTAFCQANVLVGGGTCWQRPARGRAQVECSLDDGYIYMTYNNMYVK